MFKKYFKKVYKTRLKKLKARYKRDLKERNEKFISILNHDIKTVLLAQIQTLKLFLENKVPKETLYEVLNSNYFLYEIVQNTIFLSDYENSNAPLRLENVNIAQIADIIKASVEMYAKTKNQNIILKTNSKNINCKADKLYINKIIYNLITSAVSYGFEGSDIEISIKENKNSISFKTKNKSCYMSKDKIKNILKDKSVNDFNQLGMNLNLSIANKLILAHKWDVIACSNKDNTGVLGFVVKKS